MQKKKLWLTYAWVDNANKDDHVVRELEQIGLEVKLDKRQIIPGQRLWNQIDSAISDPTSVDAWAIYASEHSLKSEPCKEEFAYALDRAIRKRGGEFPIIGIFPQPMDRELIPSAIVTRLYVATNDSEWAQQVYAGVLKTAPPDSISQPDPYVAKWHSTPQQEILELRPRTGRWYPAVFMLLAEERNRSVCAIVGPQGGIPLGGMTTSSDITTPDGIWWGQRLGHSVDPLTSMYLCFSEKPTTIVFGSLDDNYRLALT